jgi:hypothetical protein
MEENLVAGTCGGRMIVVTAKGTAVFTVASRGVGAGTFDVERDAYDFAELVDEAVNAPFDLKTTLWAAGLLCEAGGGTVASVATAKTERGLAKGVRGLLKGVCGSVAVLMLVIRGET